jgi:hypothetical protein
MELTVLRRELDQKARIVGRTLATSWEAELRRTSPVDSGLMKSRTKVRDDPTIGAGGRVNQIRIVAVVDTDYAQMVSSGTRPHVIRARGRALRFQWRGRTVYFKQVNHPGTRPNPWFTDSVRDLPRRVQEIWNRL